MGHHQTNTFEPNAENFTFGGRLKTLCLVFMGLGVLGLIWSFLGSEEGTKHSRFWTNLLTNAYYFNGIAIAAMFLVSVLTIGYGAWQTLIKRIFESFGVYVWVTLVCFVLIIIAMKTGSTNLYELWLHPVAGDTIVGDKINFLNFGMYTGGVLFFFAGWIGIGAYMRSHSLAEDGAADAVAHYQKSKYIAAAYIVLFGVSSSIFSWWAIMSLDPHWYSTMFGWYNFASYMCGMLSMMILIISYLKYKGHLRNVTENHLHDLGKFLFGFSVFWTYVWFSQFMLIWYGNIPEDTMYFVKRFDVPLFKWLFLGTFFINFVFAFLFLLKRSAKRQFLTAGFASAVLIIGHYMDFYLMVAPEPNKIENHGGNHHATEAKGHSLNVSSDRVLLANAEPTGHEAAKTEAHGDAHAAATHEGHADVKAAHGAGHHGAHHEEPPLTHASMGLIEIMIFLGFFGSFLFIVLTRLSKNRLVPINHPMLEESLRHNI